MANTVKKMLFGPYVGFFFNGHHSAEFGICRVSDGDRYTINLAPTYKDITTDREGADGTWYERTEIISETYDINIASDVIDQTTLDELKEWLKPGVAGTLIFDETPYKGVVAQIVNNPTFSFTPFGELGTRTLKGTGQLSFITYEPGILPNTQIDKNQIQLTSAYFGKTTKNRYSSFYFSYYPSITSNLNSNDPRVIYENRIAYLREQSGIYNNSVRKNMISGDDKISADFFDWASEWWEGAKACGVNFTPQQRYETSNDKSYSDGLDNIVINSDEKDYTPPDHSSIVTGDYLGFYFNGHHSSEFGIMRVSKSDVYTENLSTSFTNITKAPTASDKTISFGTHKSSIIFDIDFATDCMSLGDLEKIRQWINPKAYGEFYLDEEPNKKYLVKLYGNPTFSFIPFEDQRKVPFKDRTYYIYGHDPSDLAVVSTRTDGRTIHKGEGTISFIAYEVTPQYVYSSIKEIGLDICAGGPYYGQYKNKFWKASDNDKVKELFNSWKSDSGAQTSINNDAIGDKLLVNFMKWVNEWKGTTNLLYAPAFTHKNDNVDYTSNKINYQIILKIPSDEAQSYFENKYNNKIGKIFFNGQYPAYDNNGQYMGIGHATLNTIEFIPRKILSGTKPNSIVIDSLSNSIRYAISELNKDGKYIINYLKNLAPIKFTSNTINSRNNNTTKTNNLLPTILNTMRGKIISDPTQPAIAWYDFYLATIRDYAPLYYSVTDEGLTSNIRSLNAQARALQEEFKDRTRNGKSIWEADGTTQHFTFYDYNAEGLSAIDKDGKTISLGGVVTQEGDKFKYNGESLLNNTNPVQKVTLYKKRMQNDIDKNAEAIQAKDDYVSSNYTMYPLGDTNYNADEKLQVILFSDELLANLKDYYEILSLKVTNIEE